MIVFLPKKTKSKGTSSRSSNSHTTLAPLIDNLDIDSKGSLDLEKNFSRRNRIERLLKLIETNPHVQLNYSTKMLRLGQAFSGSPQPSTKSQLSDISEGSPANFKNHLPKIQVLP